MKIATAVRHLAEMADIAGERLRLRGTEIGWPLEELWVGGELLQGRDAVEGGVVLMLHLPPEEVPWLVLHPAGEWVGHELGLGKRPFAWFYRPAVWPAWNPRHRRLLRFWSAEQGRHDEEIEALRQRRSSGLAYSDPSDEELVAQLDAELAVSRRHLREVLDRYWHREWRREHRGLDRSPEDQLWRAAQGVREIDDALQELRP